MTIADIERKTSLWSRLTALEWFPGACTLCGADAHGAMDICRDCLERLPRIDNACRRCGKALARPTADCGFCLTRRPWPFECAVIPFHYSHGARHLITRFKYDRHLAAGRSLGLLMLQALRAGERELPRPDALLPVPLHWSKLQRRGFNQAEELARQLGRALGVPLATALCKRTRGGAAQVGLGNAARHRNVRDAFVCASVDSPVVRRVALIDDVLTSGATACAIARPLRQCGMTLQLWCLACTN